MCAVLLIRPNDLNVSGITPFCNSRFGPSLSHCPGLESSAEGNFALALAPLTTEFLALLKRVAFSEPCADVSVTLQQQEKSLETACNSQKRSHKAFKALHSSTQSDQSNTRSASLHPVCLIRPV